MRLWLNEQEVTGLCTRAVVEKSLDGAGASGEFQLVCAPADSRLPRLDPDCGQWVRAEDGGELLFSGRVEQVSYMAESLQLTLLCYDPVSLLAKNHGRGPYRGAPAEITRQLCRECGLEPGDIWEGDGEEVQLVAACERSCYRMVCNLYEDRCLLEYREGKVHLSPWGNSRAVVESGRLIALTARNTAADSVTRVQVYGGGKLVAEAVDEQTEARLGRRCRTEYLSLGKETAEIQAQAGLTGIARQARLTLAGRSLVKCGQLVTLDKPLMGVYGEYLVRQVCWRWERGRVTTELGVESL